MQPSEPESVQPGPSKEKEKEKCERDGEHFSEEDENDEKEAKDEPGPSVVKKYQDPKPKVRSKTPGKNEATEKQEEAEIAGGTHGEPAEDNGPKNEEPDENRQVHHPVRKVGQFAMDEDNVLEVARGPRGEGREAGDFGAGEFGGGWQGQAGRAGEASEEEARAVFSALGAKPNKASNL